MFWFKKSKNEANNNGAQIINSVEYESISKKLVEFFTKIELLEAEYRILKSDMENLRGRFNQRLKGFIKDDLAEIKREREAEKAEKAEKEKNINEDYIPFG
jgi:hypothetical protein